MNPDSKPARKATRKRSTRSTTTKSAKAKTTSTAKKTANSENKIAKPNASSNASVPASTLKKQVPNTVLLTVACLLIGLGLFIFGGMLWYNKLFNNPERIFWTMIGDNLTTRGVTRQVLQESGSSKSNEVSRVLFNPEPSITIRKEILQTAGAQSSHIIVEGIGTSAADYQHYAYINRTDEKGNKLDYSSVYPLWVKSSGGSSDSQGPQLVNQTLLGTTMFANLQPEQRDALVTYMQAQKVYDVDYSKAIKSKVNGRPQYTYLVTVKLNKLAKALKIYGKMTGIKGAKDVKPENYTDQDDIRVALTVDSLSKQLRTIEYRDSGAKEVYTGYGITRPMTTPAKTVSLNDFQDKLKSIEK